MVVSCGNGFVFAMRTRLHPRVHLCCDPRGFVWRNGPRTRKLPRADPRPQGRARHRNFGEDLLLRQENERRRLGLYVVIYCLAHALLLGIGGALEVAAINKPATTNAPVSVWGDGRPASQLKNG